MKSFGFTLAEVLITLSIIGVVAAITLPSLNTAIQKNKVGPSLRKFVNTMENANERILQEHDCDLLSEVNNNDSLTYLNLLKEYAKGTIETNTMDQFTPAPKNIKGEDENGPGYGASYKFNVITFANGDAMAIHINAPEIYEGHQTTSYKGYIGRIWYDLNGFSTKPNRAGIDEFMFLLDDSGTIYPDGGILKQKIHTDTDSDAMWNSENGWGACNETKNDYGTLCGASVVDNDWKVIYKY